MTRVPQSGHLEFRTEAICTKKSSSVHCFTTSHKTVPTNELSQAAVPNTQLKTSPLTTTSTSRDYAAPTDRRGSESNQSLLTMSFARNALVRASRQSATTALGYRAASTHAISKPTLANIEKRWEGMPSQEQADLWMALRDRMKESWAELTVQEKKAGKWAMPRLSSFLSSTYRQISVDAKRPIPQKCCGKLGRSSKHHT